MANQGFGQFGADFAAWRRRRRCFRWRRSKAVSTPISFTDQYLQEAPALTNALISNNSWNYGGDNAYDLAAASYDAATRDALPEVTGSQPVLFVFSAGNDGYIGQNDNGDDNRGSGTADTIASPATAKNVITVGALEQIAQHHQRGDNARRHLNRAWHAGDRHRLPSRGLFKPRQRGRRD